MQRLLAWTAHGYTALGLVCAAAIAALVVRGGDAAFRAAFVLMVTATAIDATDGWLARRARVAEVTPGFDGRRLDDLIDFLTYTCLPLLLAWRAGLLGDWSAWWLVVPLVASAYGFCQVQAKTDDNYFLGFPSYWNVVVLYLYLLELPGGGALGVVLFFAGLTFVPARYLYPSHGGRGMSVAIVFGAAWALSIVAILAVWQATPRALVATSLAYPAYYLSASWIVSVRHWQQRRGAAALH